MRRWSNFSTEPWGTESPRSQRQTVCGWTPQIRAKFTWVILRRIREVLIRRAPILSMALLYTTLTQKSSTKLYDVLYESSVCLFFRHPTLEGNAESAVPIF